MLDGIRSFLFGGTQTKGLAKKKAASEEKQNLSELMDKLETARETRTVAKDTLKGRLKSGGGVMSLPGLQRIRSIFRSTFPETSGVAADKQEYKTAKKELRQAEAAFGAGIANTKGRGCKYTFQEAIDKLDALNLRLVTGEMPSSAMRTYKNCFDSLQGALEEFRDEGLARKPEYGGYLSMAENLLGLVFDGLDSNERKSLRAFGREPEGVHGLTDLQKNLRMWSCVSPETRNHALEVAKEGLYEENLEFCFAVVDYLEAPSHEDLKKIAREYLLVTGTGFARAAKLNVDPRYVIEEDNLVESSTQEQLLKTVLEAFEDLYAGSDPVMNHTLQRLQLAGIDLKG